MVYRWFIPPKKIEKLNNLYQLIIIYHNWWPFLWDMCLSGSGIWGVTVAEVIPNSFNIYPIEYVKKNWNQQEMEIIWQEWACHYRIRVHLSHRWSNPPFMASPKIIGIWDHGPVKNSSTSPLGMTLPYIYNLVGGLNPSEKYEFVSWDYENPNIWKIKNVPNHQPVIVHINITSPLI